MDAKSILRALDGMLGEYQEYWGTEPVGVVMHTKLFRELYGPSTGGMEFVVLHPPYGDVTIVGDYLCPEEQIYCYDEDGWERYARQRDARG